MTDDNRTEVTDNFSDQSTHSPKQRVPTPPGDEMEKRDDFSSQTVPVAEPAQPTESVEELQQKLSDMEDRMLRMAADHDNFRKRMLRQQEDAIRSANDRLISQLLEVVDNFERALQHAREDAGQSAILQGTELIYNQLLSLLAKYDVRPIEAIGQPFDPGMHEAMLQVDSDQYPDGVVAMELTKGYQMGDRVIRHSKVGVSRGAGARG